MAISTHMKLLDVFHQCCINCSMCCTRFKLHFLGSPNRRDNACFLGFATWLIELQLVVRNAHVPTPLQELQASLGCMKCGSLYFFTITNNLIKTCFPWSPTFPYVWNQRSSCLISWRLGGLFQINRKPRWRRLYNMGVSKNNGTPKSSICS